MSSHSFEELDVASVLAGMRTSDTTTAGDATSTAPTSTSPAADQAPDAQAPPRTAVAQDNGDHAENMIVEQEAQDRFTLWQTGRHARTQSSPAGRDGGRPVYSEATGRFTIPTSERERIRPEPTPEERDRQAAEGQARLTASIAEMRAERERVAGRRRHSGGAGHGSRRMQVNEDEEMAESEEALEEVDDDETGTYGEAGPGRKGKGKQRAVDVPSAASGDMSDSESDGEEDPAGDDGDDDAEAAGQTPWRVGQPQVPPFIFRIPTASGGWEVKEYSKSIDFTNPASVYAANRHRRQVVLRRNKKLSLPLLRASTQDRQYDQERDDMIVAIIESYAEQNNGALLTYAQITHQYNQIYPAENRTEASISTHIAKIPQLRDARKKYAGN